MSEDFAFAVDQDDFHISVRDSCEASDLLLAPSFGKSKWATNIAVYTVFRRGFDKILFIRMLSAFGLQRSPTLRSFQFQARLHAVRWTLHHFLNGWLIS